VEMTQLGRTGLKVSRLCLGTMNFGPRTSEDDAHAIMTRALGEGVSFFDTADIYGPRGLTEEIVGRWLASDGHRDQVVLATKVETALHAVGIRLDGAALARLDEIGPGPGPAPESYAW
jgi:NDP-hexose C3-ketoreductase / dTDP-4-oxo-2-deoxy-alpha-D-pentos-2-ene 2,3-reductase